MARFGPSTTTAPLGSILNPKFPAAVSARAMTGHLLPTAVIGRARQCGSGPCFAPRRDRHLVVVAHTLERTKVGNLPRHCSSTVVKGPARKAMGCRP